MSKPASESVRFPFADLYCTFTAPGSAERRPVYGAAIIAFDGRGKWWITGITCHNRIYGRPDVVVREGTALWHEISVGLERTREEEIAAAINRALANGGHMALFDEHLPSEPLRLGPPPHVTSRLRRAVVNAAEQVASVFGLLLVLGSIVALGSIAPENWPRHRHATGVAFLADGVRK